MCYRCPNHWTNFNEIWNSWRSWPGNGFHVYLKKSSLGVASGCLGLASGWPPEAGKPLLTKPCTLQKILYSNYPTFDQMYPNLTHANKITKSLSDTVLPLTECTLLWFHAWYLNDKCCKSLAAITLPLTEYTWHSNWITKFTKFNCHCPTFYLMYLNFNWRMAIKLQVLQKFSCNCLTFDYIYLKLNWHT